MEFANSFFDDRLNSLDYNVKRYLEKVDNGYPPVPALMYCVSIIDLFGGIHAGKTDDNTENAKGYVNSYMKPIYQENFELLWNVFDIHHIRQLSFPQLTSRYKGKVITLNLHDESETNHLTIVLQNETVPVGNVGSIAIDGKFVVNVGKLNDDIIDSVRNTSSGYLMNLNTNSLLQMHFDNAMNQIFEVKDFP
jgi:hypothetical protein